MLIVSGGRARYNVANDGVEFSLSQRGRGPSDYCSPSDPHYDRVEDTHDMIPHYEREGFITNEVKIMLLCTHKILYDCDIQCIHYLQYSQVNYYSQVEACAAEYSTILEQV